MSVPAEPSFDREAPEAAGVAVELASGLVRLIAPNASPYTFTGTCSYVFGKSQLTIIDPGPQDDTHLARLLALIDGRPVEQILITHTHKDHSPLARDLAQVTGAAILGAAPHHFARPLREGEALWLDASVDTEYRPDRELVDGDRIMADGMAIETVATPGHTMNHLCFAVPERRILFSGDHVMAWSTSIVAPPDGAMGAYLRSLQKLIDIGAGFDLFLPGHGKPVRQPQRFTRALLGHRLAREAAILDRLAAGDDTTASIVSMLYPVLDARLIGAARLSVLAHLEELIAQNKVQAQGEGGLAGRFSLVR